MNQGILRRSEWTAREALACAYCWVEFSTPEDRPDSPEQYWLGITEKARNECRAIANERLLLAVARGQAVPVLPSAGLAEGQFAKVKAALGIKSDYRVRAIIDVVRSALKSNDRNMP